MLHVGILSDTHGLLRPEALAALAGSDLLLHAGDVGDFESGRGLLERLRELAPVHAVRGNTDQGSWAESLPARVSLDAAGVPLLLHHGHLPLPPGHGAEARVIVQGHSHRPLVARDGDTLHVNPGSAGRKRFRLPVTVARLRIDRGSVEAELVELA